MTAGQFDTDAAALARRIQAHDKYSSNDFDQWTFRHLELKEGLSILDLGCGIGKQTLPLAKSLGEQGKIVAVDVSQDALETLSQEAKDSNIEKRIQTRCINLDSLEGCFSEDSLDRALACYSLYYAKLLENVFRIVHCALKREGMFFFCGPAKDNNYD